MTPVATSEFTTVRVKCRASRPGAGSGDEDSRCDTILGDIPGPLRFVKLAARAPEKPTPQIWLKCSRRDCKTWNVFEVISPK